MEHTDEPKVEPMPQPTDEAMREEFERRVKDNKSGEKGDIVSGR